MAELGTLVSERIGTQQEGGVRQMANQRPTQEQIAARAYEIYLARGGDHGRDVEDWTQAEEELTQRTTSTATGIGTPKVVKEARRRRRVTNTSDLQRSELAAL